MYKKICNLRTYAKYTFLWAFNNPVFGQNEYYDFMGINDFCFFKLAILNRIKLAQMQFIFQETENE